MPARKQPTPEDTVTALRILLDGLTRDAGIFDLAGELAPLHPRNNTFPGEVFLGLAADALDWCGASRTDPLPLEEIRERFLPEATFRGRQNNKLQYAVLTAAALHGGTEPDLLDKITWWQTDDFWQYALFATVAYIRSSEVVLGTSGGVTEAGPALQPYFFRGFLAEPGPAALGMLACAAVARARYYTPASVIAAIVSDPVVTSNGDRLRFESFSGCCGVHARLDLLPGALTEPPLSSGCTNVDFNGQMRAALGGAAISGPLLLSVGTDDVTVTTLGASATERKVALPGRWLKGFGEVQALARQMRPVAGLAGTDAQRFIRGLPRSARRPLWAVPAGRALRLATAPRPGAACLAGPHRLAELGPLLRFTRGLRVYGPAVDAGSLPMPSAWELDLGTARFTLTLSPEKYRGFSGEGALLGLLADDDVAADADLISVLLAWDPQIDIGRLATEAGLPAGRVSTALSYLAAAGRVGFDLAEQAFFHRELPFGAALEAMHPRLADARALIASGSVTVIGRGALVRSGEAGQRVTFADPYDICTCPWWGKHRGTRGPCKHVLAARMAAGP